MAFDPSTIPSSVSDFAELQELCDNYLSQQNFSPGTLRYYRFGWSTFLRWCETAGVPSCPTTPQVVMQYAAWRLREGLQIMSVQGDFNSIRHHHKLRGFESPITPQVNRMLLNAKRKLRQTVVGKHPLAVSDLQTMAGNLLNDDDLVSIRDHAILVVGFASGWRGGEIASLKRADIWFDEEDRLVLTLNFSKTDQEGKHGRHVLLPAGSVQSTCPVRTMRRWLAVRGEWAGPLFCLLGQKKKITKKPISTHTVRERLRKYLGEQGHQTARFGAHSLRVGMITSAVENGADAVAISQRTGHRTLQAMMRYVRPVNGLKYDPLAGVL